MIDPRTEYRKVHRVLELQVMPGYQWLAEQEAVREGVPAGTRARITPSPGLGRPATFRWEWDAAEVSWPEGEVEPA